MATPALRSASTFHRVPSSSGSTPKSNSHLAEEADVARDLSSVGLQRYQLTPPAWTKPLQANDPASGWPGIYAPHPGEQEDATTAVILQNGWAQPTLVSSETFSLHQKLYQNLTANGGEDFQNGAARVYALIAARKHGQIPPVNDGTLKLPIRATLNEQKRENWLRDLADPQVPLARLARNVPHGFKGERMLDMLVQRQIPPDRAIWYLRAISIADVNSQRKRTNAHLRFTLDWTVEVCKYCSGLIREVALPAPQQPPTAFAPSGSNSPSGSSGRFTGMQVRAKARQSVLSDPEGQKSWTRRFTHASVLLNYMRQERLLDRPAMLAWLVDEIKRADLAQLPFVLHLQSSFQPDFALWTRATVALAEVCLAQLKVVAEQAPHPSLVQITMILRNIIRTLFVSSPESFAHPAFWTAHRDRLHAVILSSPHTEGSPQWLAVHVTLARQFESIEGRAEFLAGAHIRPLENAFTRKLALLSILDDFQNLAAIADLYVSFFLRIPGDLAEKLDVLLSWSTTPLRLGDHRVFVACNVLRLVRAAQTGPQELQDAMARWLEDSDADINRESEDALVRVVDDLAKNGIFSPGSYFQRAVARGESDLLAAKGNGIKALLSEYMPLASASKALRAQQRRSPTRDNARIGLNLALGDLRLSLKSGDVSQFLAVLIRPLDVTKATSANRKIVTELVPDAVSALLDDIGRARFSLSLAAPLLTWAFGLLEDCKAYVPLSSLMLSLLNSPYPAFAQSDTLRVCADTLVINSQVLLATDKLPQLVVRLFERFESMRQSAFLAAAGTSSRMLPVKRVIARLIMKCPTSHDTRRVCDWLVADSQPASGVIAAHSSNVPAADGALPMLKEFDILVGEPTFENASQVVSNLYWLYHNLDYWGGFAWSATLSALPEEVTSTSDSKILAFVHLCEDLHARIPGGLATGVAQASRASSDDKPPLLSSSARALLVELAANGILDAGVILHYYVVMTLEHTGDAQDATNDDRLLSALALLAEVVLEAGSMDQAGFPTKGEALGLEGPPLPGYLERLRRRRHLTRSWLLNLPSEAAFCLGNIFTRLVALADARSDTSIGSRAKDVAFRLASNDLVRRLALSRPQKVLAFAESDFVHSASTASDILRRLIPLQREVSVANLCRSSCFLDCSGRAYRLRASIPALPKARLTPSTDAVDGENLCAYLEEALASDAGASSAVFYASGLPAEQAGFLALRLTGRLRTLLAKIRSSEVRAALRHLCRCIATLPSSPPDGPLDAETRISGFWDAWAMCLAGFHRSAIDSSTRDGDLDALTCALDVAISVARVFPSSPAADFDREMAVSAILGLTSDLSLCESVGARCLDVLGVILHPLKGADLAQLDVLLRRRHSSLYRPPPPDDVPFSALNRLQHLLGSHLRASSPATLENGGIPAIIEDKPWEEMDAAEAEGPGFVSLTLLGVQAISTIESPAPPSTPSPPAPNSEDLYQVVRGKRANFEHELPHSGMSSLPVHFSRSLSLSTRDEGNVRSEKQGHRPDSVGALSGVEVAKTSAAGKKRKADVEAVEEEPARQTRSTARKKSTTTTTTRKGKRK